MKDIKEALEEAERRDAVGIMVSMDVLRRLDIEAERKDKALEWASRIIGSGLDTRAYLRYEPTKWMIEYHENFRKEE